MSATLRVSDFRDNQRLFPKSMYSSPPNIIKVEARQFPVSLHYNKVTEGDYVELAYEKVIKIHKNLPAGGILVFLTGKKEILYLEKRLKMALAKKGAMVRDDSDEEFVKGHEIDKDKSNLPQ